jgi:hypothetical protein
MKVQVKTIQKHRHHAHKYQPTLVSNEHYAQQARARTLLDILKTVANKLIV